MERKEIFVHKIIPRDFLVLKKYFFVFLINPKKYRFLFFCLLYYKYEEKKRFSKEEKRMNIVHLEPEEFVNQAFKTSSKITSRIYIVDGKAAVMVYLCQDKNNLYYMDRAQTTKEKQYEIDHMDFYELHAQLYRKIALDQKMREHIN